MTTHDDDGDSRSAPSRLRSRRTRAAIGVVGLAAVLGAGTYLFTAHIVDEREATIVRDDKALAPVVPPSSEPGSLVPQADESVAPSAASPSPSPSPTASPLAKSKPSRSVAAAIASARAAAARDGHPLQRPPKQKKSPLAPGATSTRVEETAEGSIRISTARADLTGQADQLLAADGGQPAGEARCTQNVRFSEGEPARRIPTLLLCWRTSATRSVVTTATDRNGIPSKATSLAIIDREWVKLD